MADPTPNGQLVAALQAEIDASRDRRSLAGRLAGVAEKWFNDGGVNGLRSRAVEQRDDARRELADLEAEVVPFFELGPVDDCLFDRDSGECRANEQEHPRLFDAVRRAAGENAPRATGWVKAT